MEIKGNLINGKRKYKISALLMGQYTEYQEHLKTSKDGFKNLKFLVDKTVFRIVELKIFGLKIKEWKIYDFDINVIPVENMKRFQDDFLKVIFGEDFLAQMKERGEMESNQNIIKG